MYNFDVLDIKNFQIVKTESKNFYNSDNSISLTDWIKSKTKSETEKYEFPNLSSPLNIKETSDRIKSKNSIGWFSCGTNTVERNDIDVGIYTALYSHKGTSGFEIFNTNLFEISSAFAVRNLVNTTWLNKKDIYLSPKKDSDLLLFFKINSLVVSILANTSFQSSLRQITYKNKLWDIKNEFFWMSKQEMMDLADKNKYNELYSDARTDTDRYVYKLLFGEQRIYDQLSPEAKDVLDSATNLVRLSFNMRRNFADDTNHLNSWDAGYAQLKLLWKEYFPAQFKEFRDKYKVLEDKMRPMVYELGFLMK